MRILCAPEEFRFPESDGLHVVLYGGAETGDHATGGASLWHDIRKSKLAPDARAWDFLSIALSVTAADLAGHRDGSPDGWTREFDMDVAVSDPNFWNDQSPQLLSALEFLTTDRWRIRFTDQGFNPEAPEKPTRPPQDSIALLSGGLDSLVGAIDLTAAGLDLFAVSQLVRGDASKQESFAARIGDGLAHLQLNHNVHVPDPEVPPSQRARSMVFLAYGVLVATTLERYLAGADVSLFICENGLISVNPPLTPARIGSLSTRTTHPVFLQKIQAVLSAAGLRIQLKNPYQLRTKGEMLRECADQRLLREIAACTTSCGRFQRYGYKHCGRCMPCQIRRAAFLAWGVPDTTNYVFEHLGADDEDHAGFDDVRAAAMAILDIHKEGLDRWLAGALNFVQRDNVADFKALVSRGLRELEVLHRDQNVK